MVCIGCSTLRTLPGGDNQEFSSTIYSGVRVNNAYWKCLYDTVPSTHGLHIYLLIGIIYLVPDFVLSFIADTVLLPYDAYRYTKDEKDKFPKIDCDKLSPFFG